MGTPAATQVRDRTSSGKEKAHKNKQNLGGCPGTQKFVNVFWGSSVMGEKKRHRRLAAKACPELMRSILNQ